MKRGSGGVVSTGDIEAIYGRPGFKLRRAHQISQSIFMEECRELDLTPTQFGILFVVSRQHGLDQKSLPRLLGLDRSTTGMVVKTLERRSLLCRTVDPADRRKLMLRTTAAATCLLERTQDPARRAQERLLRHFSPDERREFMTLLDKLLVANNADIRVPLLHMSGE
jgi:DNA-binding MarR family transcriptional regulator